jgi:plasmid stability protein
MKTLSIKNVPVTLHERLKKRARHNHRSLNGELLALLERAVDEESDQQHKGNLVDFLLNSPLREADIQLERDRDKPD